MEWMIATSQPFTIVEDPYFRRLIAFLTTEAESAMWRADATKDHIMVESEKILQRTIKVLQVQIFCEFI